MASLLFRLFCHLLALTVSIGIQSVQGQSELARAKADQKDVLNCVGSVYSAQRMGFMDIIADRGFTLLIGNSTVVAGGRIGKGFVIGAAHDSFLNPEPSSEGGNDRRRFFSNIMYWVKTWGETDKAALILSNHGKAKTEEFMHGHFETVVQIKASAIDRTSAEVMVIDGYIGMEYAHKLIERVRKGMGLVILATNWYHKTKYRNSHEFDYNWAPNVIAREAGFNYRYSDIQAGNGHEKLHKYWAIINPRKCRNSG